MVIEVGEEARDGDEEKVIAVDQVIVLDQGFSIFCKLSPPKSWFNAIEGPLLLVSSTQPPNYATIDR